MCCAKINEPPPSSEAVVASDSLPETSHPDVMSDYSQVGNAMVTMADMMQTFIDLAYRKFCQMSEQMDVARNVQKMVNHVKIMVSLPEKPDSPGVLPAEVIHYLRDNHILVDERTIDDFLHDNVSIGRVAKEGQFCLYAGIPASALVAIKTALESSEAQASDRVQHSQKKLMQLMKDFNTAMTMTHRVQDMNSVAVKSIEQSIH